MLNPHKIRTAFMFLLVCTWIDLSLNAQLSQRISPNDARLKIFERDNLVAWCIVPFDSQHRNSVQRAAMLSELGIRQLAYDYRAEHIPTFDAEIEALQARQIKLTAWWFPTTLNDEAKLILDVLKKHNVQCQLWVMGGGDKNMDDDAEKEFIQQEVARLKPIVEAADAIGCKVGLYNHGSWFGEPANQIKLIKALNHPGVGIVYNLHHGHDHLESLSQILAEIKPYLFMLNLNGMKSNGDRIGQKILPIGEGDRDQEVVRAIVAAGYSGPIGILNHTDEDAAARLSDNLNGLEWVVSQLSSTDSIKPAWKSYAPTPEWSQELSPRLVAESRADGDFAHGLRLFADEKFACLSCHRIGSTGGLVGPALDKINQERKPEQIVESLLWPNKEIHPSYHPVQVLTSDGDVIKGYVVDQSENIVQLRDPSTEKVVQVNKTDIEEQTGMPSLMPEGLAASLQYDELLSLISFLLTINSDENHSTEVLSELLAHAHKHEVATFAFEKLPLDIQSNSNYKAYVNRDRLYDFYTKQANYFRRVDVNAKLLQEFPGLDGHEYGHWGNQNEEYWADDTWKTMDLGEVQTNAFRYRDQVVARATAVRIPASDMSVCFDQDALQYRYAWKGGFVSYSSVRHGFLDGMQPVGEEVERPADFAWPTNARYQGRFRHADETIFMVDVGGELYLDTVLAKNGKLERIVSPASDHPFADAVRGGPRRWSSTFSTSITNGMPEAYRIDTIALPFDNPWNVKFFLGDLDFADDGTLYVCTMRGDVWSVKGLGKQPEAPVWQRYASGLYHPLGLKVIDRVPYVLGRNEITKLIDLNSDGEADEYRSFSNAMETSVAGHDFICGLETDATGNFYTASGNEGVLRVSADGQKKTIIATGFRNPDGIAVLPGGVLTVPASEGEWTPTSMICAVRPQADEIPFFGYRGPKHGGTPVPPMLYLPRGIDNSSGAQVYVDSPAWGPYQGHLVHLSYGAGTFLPVLWDNWDGVDQAAAVAMPGEFSSGVHRGAISPIDGQLYVCGMAGWGTYTSDTGCLQRVSYSAENKTAPLPVGWKAYNNGISIEFDIPLDDEQIRQAIDTTNHFVQAWNYRYAANYGSAEYSIEHYGVRGHDRLTIASCHVGEDRKTVFIALPELQLCNQLHVNFGLETNRRFDLYATCNVLRPAFEFPGYVPVRKTLRPHPLLRDIALASKSKPNPFRQTIEAARVLEIAAGPNLSYSTKELHVKAGETLRLVFSNPDVVPHNWALIQPGSLQEVGNLANRLIGDPDAAANQYIPASDKIICYTDIVEANNQFEIYFHAPQVPGDYPFLCTFPGHWMVMNGMLVVEE